MPEDTIKTIKRRCERMIQSGYSNRENMVATAFQMIWHLADVVERDRKPARKPKSKPR